MKKKNGAAEAPVVAAAIDLAQTIDELERVTVRCSKIELTSRGEIVRAGELLQQAADSHRAFLAHLGALTQAVGALRDRQNASAARLSEQANRVDERRKEHETLEERFASLGAAAREIGEAMRSSGPPEDMKASLVAATGRLSEAVESARALSADAREARFPELEAQAHAIRQQLQALLRRIEEMP